MDIGQAVRRLKNGDKIRRQEWDEDRFLDLDAAEVPNLTYEDLLADDWEIYDG
jgi:hypothetical protein